MSSSTSPDFQSAPKFISLMKVLMSLLGVEYRKPISLLQTLELLVK